MHNNSKNCGMDLFVFSKMVDDGVLPILGLENCSLPEVALGGLMAFMRLGGMPSLLPPPVGPLAPPPLRGPPPPLPGGPPPPAGAPGRT